MACECVVTEHLGRVWVGPLVVLEPGHTVGLKHRTSLRVRAKPPMRRGIVDHMDIYIYEREREEKRERGAGFVKIYVYTLVVWVYIYRSPPCVTKFRQ